MSIEAMKQALENCRLLAARHRKEEWAQHILRFCEDSGVIANTLRAAIEQAEKQEPVAWVECDGELVWNNREAAIGRNLYTAPPQREWQGLTDQEIKEIVGPWGDTPIKGYTRKLFDQIETKLKEKNT